VLSSFTDALLATDSILQTSEWIKMLLDLLRSHCYPEAKVCLDKEGDNDLSDMEAEMNSEELLSACNVAATQLTGADDNEAKVLSPELASMLVGHCMRT